MNIYLATIHLTGISRQQQTGGDNPIAAAVITSQLIHKLSVGRTMNCSTSFIKTARPILRSSQTKFRYESFH